VSLRLSWAKNEFGASLIHCLKKKNTDVLLKSWMQRLMPIILATGWQAEIRRITI
jgi:hypothetical protein